MPDIPTTPPAPMPNLDLPKGGLARVYGLPIGVLGSGLAMFEFLRDDPHETFRLLGEFGPKYLLGAFLAFIVWDLLRRGLKMVSRGVEHIGALATNTGEVALAVKDYAGKNDSIAEEMRRLCIYAAQKSDRSVEIASENSTKLDRIMAKMEEKNHA